MGLMAGGVLSAIFNGMPGIVFEMVRLTLTISVSKTVRS